MLICIINTHLFQIIYKCIDVSRHSSERINPLSTISYGKYFFTFRTYQLSTRFFEWPTFDIRGYIVSVKKLCRHKLFLETRDFCLDGNRHANFCYEHQYCSGIAHDYLAYKSTH